MNKLCKCIGSGKREGVALVCLLVQYLIHRYPVAISRVHTGCNPETRALSRRLMDEVASGSAACARPKEEAFLDKMMDHTDKMAPYAPSMKLDYEAGRPMELEAIYGNPLRAAAAAGAAMPETEKLYGQLMALEQKTIDR